MEMHHTATAITGSASLSLTRESIHSRSLPRICGRNPVQWIGLECRDPTVFEWSECEDKHCNRDVVCGEIITISHKQCSLNIKRRLLNG